MSIDQFAVTTDTGETQTLQQFAGQVLLIVNVASKCGLTPQYEALEALYRSGKDRGLEVLRPPVRVTPAPCEVGSADSLPAPRTEWPP